MKKCMNEPLEILFEKNLYGGEFLTGASLVEGVLNAYMEYLEQSGAIIRKKDEDTIKEEVTEEILEMFHEKVGREQSIQRFLSGCDDLEEKKQKTEEKFLELYIELENSIRF